jgi:acetyltransferase-like isoleucine patch superfamily enzyme
MYFINTSGLNEVDAEWIKRSGSTAYSLLSNVKPWHQCHPLPGFVPEYSILEEGCRLGPNVVLTNAEYQVSIKVKESLKGPIIKKGAKIKANGTVLPGVVIGEKALVGAGTVVCRVVPDGAVVVGYPGRGINHISNLPY